MDKLAVFVEGATEVGFIENLIKEVAGHKNVLFETREISGGSTVPRKTKVLRAATPTGEEKYYVLLMDCGGDHQVKTRILEEHENLTKAGYSKIIGLRDVRPTFTLAEVPQLAASLRKYIKTSLIPVDILLAAMEIEAWFLSEHTHYPKIDPALTTAAIQAALGFDPAADDMTQRHQPTDDLNAAYQIVGQHYAKPATATLAALDYSEVYLSLPARIAGVSQLAQHLNEFIG